MELQCDRQSPGATGEEFSVIARREEVGTASGGNAEEEEGGLPAVISFSHADSLRPIGTNRS